MKTRRYHRDRRRCRCRHHRSL